ncbi:thioesterase [Aeromicrobium fastidiosum]|uniref:Thioesterase n=2 Tax=Aeromicrobium fastidiosum TaxID=52699 RepID=A0A641ATA5_9ACTN|nr:thioesterase [Aeromicrobium fastidiosum]
MNIGRYMELGGTALWQRCRHELGMSDDYIELRGFSTFTAEHHLTYHAELLEGDDVSVRVRLVARSDKVMHVVCLIVDETHRRLACTMETTAVHVDMTTRRPTPFPDDVTALIDAAIAADDRPWPAPLSGAMGVRRR